MNMHSAKAWSLKPVFLFLVLVISATGYAQNSLNYSHRSHGGMGSKIVVLPAGTIFEGRIDSSVGSRLSHSGERFTITLSQPIIANGTDVLIPAGSQIICEVVEAIPSSRLPRQKGMPPPNGKLRIQLTSLRMPDGINYPLIASIVGDDTKMGHSGNATSSGIGYIGSSSSFDSVAPGAANRYMRGGNRQSTVITRQMLMQDPIYGAPYQYSTNNFPDSTIRSLVKKDHDLYIDHGAPLTMRLDAPFKFGINPLDPGTLDADIRTLVNPSKPTDGSKNSPEPATPPAAIEPPKPSTTKPGNLDSSF